MAFKNPRNSRDDKSGKSSGRPAKGDGAKRTTTSSARGKFGTDKPGTDRPKRSYNSDPSENRSFSRKPSGTGYGPGDKPARKFGSDAAGDKKSFGDKKPFGTGRKPYGDRDSKPAFGDRPKRAYGNNTDGDKKPFGAGRKPFGDRDSKPAFGDRPKRAYNSDAPADRKTGGFKKREGDNVNETPFRKRPESSYAQRRERQQEEAPERIMRSRNKKADKPADDGLIRLNRYISNAGICSRRKADELIVAGVVSVNGEVISELGFKVNPQKDVIRYNGETLKREKMVYVLLNKPKDYITTTDDPQERRTVMHLVEKASRERIYPVGRLDRNTTGLLLMTNDGDLADKLSHPRNSVVKLYQVELNKALTQGDLNKIGFGLELEDGFIKPDMVAYVTGGTKREVGIQIHSGKNRIVRRIFESLGYEVVKLDRTIYANLTKKDLPRGRWRFLEEEEIIQLKHLIK
ncbi:rRNA pseudouridine synthase [Mucilaginibacter mali]|uniref:Pseudouridine synthase n=1 Tax=Mucilaginibacter mali TaxID=2740462 RepID=A0A7D4TXF8_9SPHI|nr:pseudouridine synthase [Mucilaginibacter mali]QKJ32335.1 rRNA pseudouridine synthase [Mucilaginibacter mali]